MPYDKSNQVQQHQASKYYVADCTMLRVRCRLRGEGNSVEEEKCGKTRCIVGQTAPDERDYQRSEGGRLGNTIADEEQR